LPEVVGAHHCPAAIDDNNRPYRAVIKVLPEGGTVLGRGDCLRVEGASAVTVIYTAATGYRLKPPDYRGAAPEAIAANVLNHLAGLSFQAIREEHIRDYQRLYLRTQFHLGGGLPDREALPTNERWQLYAKRDFADLGLKELAFNLRKYLLISASRPGSVPAGIQGAWSAHSGEEVLFDAIREGGPRASWAGQSTRQLLPELHLGGRKPACLVARTGSSCSFVAPVTTAVKGDILRPTEPPITWGLKPDVPFRVTVIELACFGDSFQDGQAPKW
jgi:hypothetical protein